MAKKKELFKNKIKRMFYINYFNYSYVICYIMDKYREIVIQNPNIDVVNNDAMMMGHDSISNMYDILMENYEYNKKMRMEQYLKNTIITYYLKRCMLCYSRTGRENVFDDLMKKYDSEDLYISKEYVNIKNSDLYIFLSRCETLKYRENDFYWNFLLWKLSKISISGIYYVNYDKEYLENVFVNNNCVSEDTFEHYIYLCNVMYNESIDDIDLNNIVVYRYVYDDGLYSHNCGDIKIE